MKFGEQSATSVEALATNVAPIVTKLEPGTQVQDTVQGNGEEAKIYHCVAKLKRREKPSDVSSAARV